MANLREWLEEVEALYGEQIEAVVVGRHDSLSFSDSTIKPDENVVITREAALTKVDEDFDSGYGGADCYPVLAWTASRVFFVGEYDGATGLNYVPRHPVACEPQFSGQSPAIDSIRAPA